MKAKDRSFAKVVTRLEKQGRAIRRLDEAFDQDCARQSYGQVQDYLRANPCEGLGRALFEITEAGITVVVAVAVVDMADENDARELHRLLDTHGTGNITELRGTRRVTWTGEQYASGRHETTVVNAQAEPTGRTAAAVRLASSLADSLV
ncbi:hypothetical protein [Pseudonocardia pini]|uniref:hypothetical protein n=1 Tax=Pseudonocardia pini TaxID=2758030 RepID=UPI0015F0F850|nr:hypothetical protein [Pseudonocardia pini]